MGYCEVDEAPDPGETECDSYCSVGQSLVIFSVRTANQVLFLAMADT